MDKPVHIAQYEILEELGRGGFAVVYKARDTRLDRIVALKVLHPYWSEDPGFVARFQREARAAANLRHPNIVTVYDASEAGGQLYIAMEYLPGRTLRELLEAEGALSLEQALPILEQAADALDYAHRQGVVHRDIKPANMMVEETERGVHVTLMDFGLAKAMEGSTALTSMGTLLGSPEFMAPEQADPNRAAEVGPATDCYALGIVAYQMLTGRVPFPGNTPATLNAHLHMPPPEPHNIRDDLPDVAAALLKMLSKSPADRFASAGDFVAQLRKSLPADRQRRQREAQLAPLYERMQVAAAQEDWAEVLTLGGQIQALDAGYRDVRETMEHARAQMRRLRPGRRKLSLAWKWLALGAAALALAGVFMIAFAVFNPDLPARLRLLTIYAWIRPTDGMAMVSVPAGNFLMGSADSDPLAYSDEKPQRAVYLDAFWIDRTEVTNAQYIRCVQAGQCKASSYANDSRYNGDSLPVVGVDWNNAVAYCRRVGGTLPTEAQWEKAARGADGRRYPWGNRSVTCEYAVVPDRSGNGCGKNAAWPVGSKPRGASPYGALDMVGNVWEWVADWYGNYAPGLQVNPIGPPSGQYRVVRGGSWDESGYGVSGAVRYGYTPDDRGSNVGFRCVGVGPGK